VKVNSGNERRFCPCRGGDVKREGEETWARRPEAADTPLPPAAR
jgi:hypothetical protein